MKDTHSFTFDSVTLPAESLHFVQESVSFVELGRGRNLELLHGSGRKIKHFAVHVVASIIFRRRGVGKRLSGLEEDKISYRD